MLLWKVTLEVIELDLIQVGRCLSTNALFKFLQKSGTPWVILLIHVHRQKTKKNFTSSFIRCKVASTLRFYWERDF